MTELPTYMKQVLRFSIKENGILSSLPYLAMWLFSMFIAFVADWMISSKRFSHTATRKIINSIGMSFFYKPLIPFGTWKLQIRYENPLKDLSK